MSPEIVSVNVCCNLSKKEWDALQRLDFTDEVLPAMRTAGADKVEYNGHFGRNIFYTVRQQDQLKAMLAVYALIGNK